MDYLEFLAASLGPEDYEDETNVKAAFMILDKDGNGKLDYGELVRVLGKIGNENDVQAIIKAVDTYVYLSPRPNAAYCAPHTMLCPAHARDVLCPKCLRSPKSLPSPSPHPSGTETAKYRWMRSWP